MGYFRLFYYISYTLNFLFRLIKRHGKFLFLFLCIFIFLVFCMYNPSANAEWSTTDKLTLDAIRTYLSNISLYISSQNVDDDTFYEDCLDALDDLHTVKLYLEQMEGDERAIRNYLWETNNTINDIYEKLYGVHTEDAEDEVVLHYAYYTNVFCGSTKVTTNVARARTYVAEVKDISEQLLYTINASNIPTGFGSNSAINIGFINSLDSNSSTYNVTTILNDNSTASVSTSGSITNSNNYNYFFISFLPASTYDYSNVSLSLKYYGIIPGTDTNGFFDDVTEGIADTNDKIENVQNTITDSSINIESSLPTDETQDITASGVDNLFTILKNAFTSSSYSDLTIQVPFTNKSFVINPNNVYGGFNNNAVTNMINLFWWYMISRFIILDIMNKINSIKGGNVENIENGNIKGDLL